MKDKPKNKIRLGLVDYLLAVAVGLGVGNITAEFGGATALIAAEASGYIPPLPDDPLTIHKLALMAAFDGYKHEITSMGPDEISDLVQSINIFTYAVQGLRDTEVTEPTKEEYKKIHASAVDLVIASRPDTLKQHVSDADLRKFLTTYSNNLFELSEHAHAQGAERIDKREKALDAGIIGGAALGVVGTAALLLTFLSWRRNKPTQIQNPPDWSSRATISQDPTSQQR